MKNEKRPGGALTEPAGSDERFSAYGWVRDAEDSFTLDNPVMILEYLVATATPVQEDAESAGSSARAMDLLKSVDVFLEAYSECSKGRPDEHHRKAMVAMYMLGVGAANLEEEINFPSISKLKSLKRDVKQMRLFNNLKQANMDQDVGRGVAQSIARDYARLEWMKDARQEVRIGTMTRKVWRWMAEHEFLVEHRPDTEKSLREWLKPVAADFPYSQERGRPRKK